MTAIAPEVRAVFAAFTARFEGLCLWMYLDVKGLVTTGRGNLIDPIEPALRLPWHRADGSLANPSEVSAEWYRVKRLQGAKGYGGGWFARVTTLRLRSEDVDALDLVKMQQFADELASSAAFAGFERWPASAQLGVLSMAWALGPGFAVEFPRFASSAAAEDWAPCAGPMGDADRDISCRGEAWIRDGTPGQPRANENPGLRPRNLANKRLFEAAANGTDLVQVVV